VVRESQWNWFTADLRTRLKPGAGVVVVMTRWHPDDLGGRLLERQPGLWRVVSIPAIAGDNDPLGRKPGEWLWDKDPKYGYGKELRAAYAEAEASGAMRDWSALYQQQPTNAEGSLFKIGMVETLEAAPAVTGQVVRAWDLAATKQIGTRDPDWTAGIKLMRTAEGRFIVLDVVRVRGGPDEVEATIVNTAKRDGLSVRIGLPQDPGQAGKTQVLYLTRKLQGFRVESSTETGDKVTRAAPMAAQANVGNLSVVGGNDWCHKLIDELASFPGGSKDDQVDALSRAFSMLGMKLDYRSRFEALSS
ncbi:MAG: Large terminase subunit, partial [Rhodoferax sp.]|nr:Large terminase subunit [Rhodoferax sp.]